MKVPEISLRKIDETITDREALVSFVFSNEVDRFPAEIKKALGKDVVASLSRFVSERDFKALPSDFVYYPTKGGHLSLLVGLGNRKKFKSDVLRRAAAASLKTLEKLRINKSVITWPTKITSNFSEREAIHAIAEGVILGAYEFDKYKKKKEAFSTKLIELGVVSESQTNQQTLNDALTVGRAVNDARNMQNDNADNINPESFARIAEKIADKHDLHITILDAPELERKGLSLLHAVGRASPWPAKLIILEYRGDRSNHNYQALVGKGITFDTGGVNLKPTAGGFLEQMHLDMSGAAAVLYTIRAVSQLKLKTNILAVLPIAENALSGNAIKPGSVVKAYNGTSVEITNTDAEGRLIMADAIAYVTKEYKVNSVIDIATLTGSIIVALGNRYAGLVSNNKDLVKNLTEASERVSEELWQLPLNDRYRSDIKGTKSDVINATSGKAQGADAILAGAFLERFAGNVPFAHIDAAGTAMRTRAESYMPMGGTGYGVRLLIDYLKNFPRGPRLPKK